MMVIEFSSHQAGTHLVT